MNSSCFGEPSPTSSKCGLNCFIFIFTSSISSPFTNPCCPLNCAPGNCSFNFTNAFLLLSGAAPKERHGIDYRYNILLNRE